MICNGLLGPKEYPSGMCFWPKPFFLEPHENPDAAIIPLRGSSKATGNSRSFITAFFFKSTTLLFNSPAPLSSGWVMGLPYFLEQEFSVTVQYGLLVPGGRGGELALRTPWCFGVLTEPSLLLSSGLWLAGQPSRYPLAKREKTPSSTGLLGILVGLTLINKLWALFFLPGAQSTSRRGCCLSQYNPNLSIDLCNIYCSGLEKNGKPH